MTTRKRSNHDGSVFFDTSSGRWIAEVSAGHDDDGRRRRIRRKTRTKTEAHTKLRELKRQLDKIAM